MQSPRFFDRAGNLITLAQAAAPRPELRMIDRWRGEGGAHIEVYWVGPMRRPASMPVQRRSGCRSRRSTIVRCPNGTADSSPRRGLSITFAGLCRWSSGASDLGMTKQSMQPDSPRWCCAPGDRLEATVQLSVSCIYSGPRTKTESRTSMTRLICSSRFSRRLTQVVLCGATQPTSPVPLHHNRRDAVQ